MKVLHFSTNDIKGGAAKAAFRIHQAVEQLVDSFMAVNNKESDEYRILFPQSLTQRTLIKVLTQLNYQPARFLKGDKGLMFSNGLLSSPGQFDILHTVNPDIVNLHWINEGLLSIKRISQFSTPVVWTVHDMWPFTGGCHYTINCEAYKSKCGKCPQLNSRKQYDLSTYVFNLKKRLKNKITFVAPSLWMKRCIEESDLFKDSPVLHIPYPINTELYKPRSKSVIRELFGLPQNKNLILFGAMNALQDERKGYNYLLRALEHLRDDQYLVENTEIVVFGSSRPQDELNKMFKTHYLGRFADELSLSLIYSACDVFVAPSTQDNLPNTVIESLASGVPVVAFSIGGMTDMIESGVHGFLAEPLSSEGLAVGIKTVLMGDRTKWASNSRKKVIDTYLPLLIANQYRDLYNTLV